MWKQQGLFCVLVADLVSDDDLARLKQYFVKVRSATRPRVLAPVGALAAARGAVRSTTKGRAIRAHSTMTTSESPKLYSVRPETRKPGHRAEGTDHEAPVRARLAVRGRAG